MSSRLLNEVLFLPWKPQCQFVRFRKRINIQRPIPPHFERAKMIAVTQPQFIQKPENATRLCLKSTENHNRIKIDNPFEIILAREFKNWLDHSNFVAFFHTNPMKAEEKFKYTVLLKRQGMNFKVYGKSIVARAVENTPYEPILQLFTSQQAMVFAEKTESVAKLLKMIKRLPQIVLMAGIVENRLLSRSQLERFAALPDLITAQAQLVSLLAGAGGPGARLVSQLNTHQQNLVSNLEQRIEQLKPAVANEEEKTI